MTDAILVADQLSETCKCGTKICVDHSGKYLFRFDTDREIQLQQTINELRSLVPRDRSDELNRQITRLERKVKRQAKQIDRLKEAINEGQIRVIIS
jgi:uncharacterized coiled-coil protein SlyX